MEKLLARHVNWTGSGNQESLESEEIPLPEVDETLIDTQYIHWGYLNCCQTIANGKKVKVEKWSTFWVEVCGSTIKLYKDKSLHIESNICPPPSSPTCLLEENEEQIAFFGLQNAAVNLLSNEKFSQMFSRHCKSKKSVASKANVFHRHLFQLKLPLIHNTYIFQAPSHSAMLRWVSKIQESIDSIENNEKPELAVQRLKLARDIMARRIERTSNNQLTGEEADTDDELADTESLLSMSEACDTNPRLMNLKNQLATKHEQLWQFEVQIIDFLGRGKGEFKREEFMCKTKDDYFLVPGRIETYIPAGTKVTIFGQLPNRRWRCLVEMNELIKVMGVLVDHLKIADDAHNKSKKKTSGQRNLEALENLLNNLPEYPLIGCLPTSVLDFDPNTPVSYECQCENANDVCVADIHIKVSDSLLRQHITADDLKITDLDAPSGHSESESGSEGEAEFEDDSNNDTVQLREKGIIIQKKLRQKGISILVGSSSSEDEGENVGGNDQGRCSGISNAAYHLFSSAGVSRSEDLGMNWKSEDIIKDFSNPVQQQQFLPKSYSCGDIQNNEFTANPDLLHRFGQQSIHLEQDKALAKALLQVFHESKKGPDVQPPRNERRTLKLSKSDDQGYGFWLQTYDFGKAGIGKKRTFVRFVEDEGPAYLAGLREGDVIVEVNELDVEEIEHMKIVGLISETAKQLILVVKFMDMVRRVELAVRLKKSQVKLKSKREELLKIEKEENDLYNMAENKTSTEETRHLSCPGSLEGDLDQISIGTSSQSSSSSSINDEVVVRTSKFEKRSSRVLDSIKELNCACSPLSSAGIKTPLYNKLLSTTENDLLSIYSDNVSSPNLNCFPIIKHIDPLSASRRNSYPFENVGLDGEHKNVKKDTLSVVEDCSCNDGNIERFDDDSPKTVRSKSYKKAVNMVNYDLG